MRNEGPYAIREAAYVVLAKRGILQILECPRTEVFAIARVVDAGICGVFTTRREAEVFMTSMDVLPECMRCTELM